MMCCGMFRHGFSQKRLEVSLRKLSHNLDAMNDACIDAVKYVGKR